MKSLLLKFLFLFFLIFLSKTLFANNNFEERIENIEDRLNTIEDKIDELIKKSNEKPSSLVDLLNEIRDNSDELDNEKNKTELEDKKDESISNLIVFKGLEARFEKSKKEYDLTDEYLYFKYQLFNNYTKGIKLIDHSVIIKDLLGEYLTKLNLEKDLSISSNTLVIDDGFYDVTYSFTGNPKRIKKIAFKDLVFEYVLNKIVFEDNTILSFDE
ncbi:hypothetical protein OAN10_03360 [Alphaproteobacteria bacterium]|nr:hypothetical protein [Alphaproteobacteria bacterium]